MRSLDIGPPQDEAELRALAEVEARSFFGDPRWWVERLRTVDPALLRVVRQRGDVVGGLALDRLGQWFGGRSVPAGGLSAVAVAPEHRAGGLASRLVRGVLEELHEQGLVLSVLYPATVPVYRRLGYELAGDRLTYRLPLRAIPAPPEGLQVRRAGPEERRRLQELYGARARASAGHLDRNDRLWNRALGTDEGAQAYVVERGGTGEGYLVYAPRRTEGGRHDLHVRDLVALTPGAARRILAFCAHHRSLAEHVAWPGGPADPLLYHVAERAWTVAEAWVWMLRLVDVRGALSARGYPQGVEAELHLEVADDVLGWNAGRWVLQVEGGTGRVRRGGRGRLRADVRGLAALYSGRLSPHELRVAGYLDGPQRDLQAAAAVFAGPAPWMPDFF